MRGNHLSVMGHYAMIEKLEMHLKIVTVVMGNEESTKKEGTTTVDVGSPSVAPTSKWKARYDCVTGSLWLDHLKLVSHI